MPNDMNINTSLLDSLKISEFNKQHIPLKGIKKPDEEKNLQSACKNFETLLTQRMLNQMFKSTDFSTQFGQGSGGEFFAEMYTGNIAKEAADNNNFGLAEQMIAQLKSRGNIDPAVIQKIRELDSSDRLNFIPQQLAKSPVEQNKNLSLIEKYSRPNSLTPDKVSKYDSIIDIQAEKQGVDSALIKAVIKNESNGDHKAVSSAGAKGLMQLMDSTASDLGVNNPFHPGQNIAGGTKYLKMLLEKYDNNLPKAIAAYNAGPGNVDKYKGIPPFNETKEYVKRVMKDFKKYSNGTDLITEDN
jgi:Rod binding domain-containing protein